MNRFAPLLALAWFAAAASSAPAESDLNRDAQIRAVIEAPRFRQAHWGLLVADRHSGEALYAHQAEKLFAPASTTKLFTVAAALEVLGADHRFETPLVRRGEIDASGTLEGDLILVASGDPTLGGRTLPDGTIAFADNDHTYANGNFDAQLTPPDPLAGLDALARQAAKAGIRRVAGNVLIDDRLFEPYRSTGSGPERVVPIIVNDNLLDLTILPGPSGTRAQIDWRPRTSLVAVESQVDTVAGEGRAEITSIEWTDPRHLVVRGTIPHEHAPLVQVAELLDPAQAARAYLIEALRRAGVEVAADPAAAPEAARLPQPAKLATLPVVARIVSPPLAEEARLILKVSHNLHASLLPVLLALNAGKRTLDEGLFEERRSLARLGIDPDTISFGGGAGGSRADWVSPAAAVALLRQMAARPDFEIFHRALPVLGVDGTLAKAVPPDSPAKGAARAKTGTFYWHNALRGKPLLLSKALAGYLTTAGGRELAFAFFVNNVHLETNDERQEIGRVLGQLCEIVYGWQ